MQKRIFFTTLFIYFSKKSAETSNVDPVMRYMEQPQSGFDFIRC